MGGGEAKKRKKPHNRLGGKEKKNVDKEGLVLFCSWQPDDLLIENNKEAGGEAQRTQGLSENRTSRESVSPLSCMTRGFLNNYH